jgi:hypothetical protein
MPASLGEISVEMVRDMETTNNELADLEDELEIQKEAIQKQIVNACDASERSSSSLAEIEEQEVPPSITSLLTRLSFLTSADLVGESGSVGTLGDEVAKPFPCSFSRSASLSSVCSSPPTLKLCRVSCKCQSLRR